MDIQSYWGLPYRSCVGLMIINSDMKVFVAKRRDSKVSAWQMPQGGIDLGETPSKAAFREMKEEIGSDNAVIIAETKRWYSYDIPISIVPRLWGGAYRGQQQKWFLMKFCGLDSEININTANPEFHEWKWVKLSMLTQIVVPFKKKLYHAVIEEFLPFFHHARK